MDDAYIQVNVLPAKGAQLPAAGTGDHRQPDKRAPVAIIEGRCDQAGGVGCGWGPWVRLRHTRLPSLIRSVD
jgi:hypothetical protein